MDQDRIQQWLTDRPEGLKIAPISPPGRSEIEKAIRCSPSTTPGPDGIPFACWRGLGQLGLDILTDVLGVLCSRDGEAALAEMGLDEEGRHPYNEGLRVLLPKKPAGADPRGVPYFESEGTRPLSIVNTDNRIVANAIRYKFEAPLAKNIAQHQ